MSSSPVPFSDAESATGQTITGVVQAANGAARHNGVEAINQAFRLKLALGTAIKLAPGRLTESNTLLQPLTTAGMDVVATEVLCARHFNTPLPEALPEAIAWLDETLRHVCQVNRCAVFLYDDERDLYLHLTNESGEEATLNQLSDDSLQAFLGTEKLVHGHLLYGQELLGLLAVADKTDGTEFDADDELRLDILGPYLAATLVTFRRLKANALLSTMQRTVLAISSQLIKAVDQENVLSITLEAFGTRLGFDACQYIQRLDDTLGGNSSNGEVLLECVEGKVTSVMHAGLKDKRHSVTEFDALIGLFQSSARPQPYLLLPGTALGSQPMAEKFSLTLNKGQTVKNTLILPVLDPATGRIRGTINLYRLSEKAVEQGTLDLAQELIGLVSLALSRVMVLEMALEMASTDELTGLTNRRGFYDRFEAEIERARRINSPMCVAMLDVDYFKKINDTYGHLNGDAVLHQLGQVISHRLRKSDLVCRFGGEEFAILLPDTKFEDAAELLDRIRAAVAEKPLKALEGNDIPVTVSAGLSKVVIPGLKEETKPGSVRSHGVIGNALESADKQLYLAKSNGRNRVCATCE